MPDMGFQSGGVSRSSPWPLDDPFRILTWVGPAVFSSSSGNVHATVAPWVFHGSPLGFCPSPDNFVPREVAVPLDELPIVRLDTLVIQTALSTRSVHELLIIEDLCSLADGPWAYPTLTPPFTACSPLLLKSAADGVLSMPC